MAAVRVEVKRGVVGTSGAQRGKRPAQMEITQELTRIYQTRALCWFDFGLCLILLNRLGFEWVFFWCCFWIWLYVLNGLVDCMERGQG